MAVQGDRVGVLDPSGRRGDHPGNADANGGEDAELRLGLAHEGGEGVERVLVAVRCGNPVAQRLAAVGVKDGDLDFGAAKVDADTIMGHGIENAGIGAPRQFA